jgi:hypothetical protein
MRAVGRVRGALGSHGCVRDVPSRLAVLERRIFRLVARRDRALAAVAPAAVASAAVADAAVADAVADAVAADAAAADAAAVLL